MNYSELQKIQEELSGVIKKAKEAVRDIKTRGLQRKNRERDQKKINELK